MEFVVIVWRTPVRESKEVLHRLTYRREWMPERNLSGQGKSGHAWSLQNRPYEMARDAVLIYPAFS